MAKKLIVLSDGTGNSAARLFKTNVWKLYEALDLTPSGDQIAAYDDGVGTSRFKPWAMLTGAFGFGLKRNVLKMYVFLSRHYHNEIEAQSKANPGRQYRPARHLRLWLQPWRLHDPGACGSGDKARPGATRIRSRDVQDGAAQLSRIPQEELPHQAPHRKTVSRSARYHRLDRRSLVQAAGIHSGPKHQGCENTFPRLVGYGWRLRHAHRRATCRHRQARLSPHIHEHRPPEGRKVGSPRTRNRRGAQLIRATPLGSRRRRRPPQAGVVCRCACQCRWRLSR